MHKDGQLTENCEPKGPEEFLQSLFIPDDGSDQVMKAIEHADSEFKGDKYDDELKLYIEAGDALPIIQKAKTLVESKQLQPALKFYNSALSLAPKDIKVFNAVCAALSYLGSYQMARTQYALKPIEWFVTDNNLCSASDRSIYWNNSGDLYYNLGDYKQALNSFIEAEKQGTNLTVLYNLLEVSLTLGLSQSRIAELYAKLEKDDTDPTDFNKRLISAYVLLTKNELQESYDAFISLYKEYEPPPPPDLMIGLGQTCLQKKDYPAALDYFDKVLKLYPNNLRALTGHADAQRELGNSQLALTSYQKVLRISKGYLDALDGLAMLHYKKGEMAQAIRNLNLILAACPQNPKALESMKLVSDKYYSSSASSSSFSSSSTSSSMLVEPPSSKSSHQPTMFPAPLPKINIGNDISYIHKVSSTGTEITFYFKQKTQVIHYMGKLNSEEKPALQSHLKTVSAQIKTRMTENLPMEDWLEWFKNLLKAAMQNNPARTYSQSYVSS